MLASINEFKIEVTGRGGHAAMPYQRVDPMIVAGAAIVQALQTIASCNVADGTGPSPFVASVAVVPKRDRRRRCGPLALEGAASAGKWW